MHAVTARTLGIPNASYWVQNVREPVLFQQAIEHIFKHDTPPELVLEIGPHRTLVSPILETVSTMQKSSLVIPILKRGGPCGKNFLEAVGMVYEKTMPIALEEYATSLGFEFDEHLPKHPFVYKPLWPTKQVLEGDAYCGINHMGPAAGQVSRVFAIFQLMRLNPSNTRVA